MLKFHISNGIPMSAQISLSNAEMLKVILDYYSSPESVIADVTYGLGNFWNIEPYRAHLLFSDLMPLNEKVKQMDYNDLREYQDESIDVIVFDRPYMKTDMRKFWKHSNKNGFAGIDSKIELRHIIGNNEIPFNSFNRVLRKNGLIICKDSQFENTSKFKQIDIFLSVTPQVLAMFTKTRHSRQNYQIWHILQKD